MRNGRYVINDELEPADEISGVTWSVDRKNVVKVQWKWPQNNGIKLCVLFTAVNVSDTLEELLESQPDPVIITRGVNRPYTKPLDVPQQIYKIYPAKFGDGSDIIILNQLENNATGVVTKVMVVNYKIEHKPIPLSDLQRVVIGIHCPDKLPADNIITYAKYKNSACVCIYPISGSKDATYECFIEKSENIVMHVNEDYAERVILKEERADGIAKK